MSIKNRICVLALLTGAALASQGAHAAYKIKTFDLHRPGMASTTVYDGNNSGALVGSFGNYEAEDSSTWKEWGFVHQSGVTMVLQGPTGATMTFASGISDNGVIVGQYADGSLTGQGDQRRRGFIYANGSYTSFDAPGASTTYVLGVSSDGRYISGNFSIEGSVLGQGFVYDRHSSHWTVIGPATESSLTVAKGFNDHGIVAGSELVYPEQGGRERLAFTYDLATGQRSLVSFAGTTGAMLRDIDNNGLMAGALFFDPRANTARAFVGTAAAPELLDLPGAIMSWAYSINGAGQVVGTYIDADYVYHGFIATSVPEPATWAFMLGGAGFLAWRRRKVGAEA